MVLQPDGKIVVAGFIVFLSSTQTVIDVQMFAVRFLSSGGLDFGFGTNGIGQLAGVVGLAEHAWDIAIDQNGRILLVGNSVPLAGPEQLPALARILR